MSAGEAVRHELITPTAPHLHVELQDGAVRVRATDTDRVVVDVQGERAEEVTVEQAGDLVRVRAPRRFGFGSQAPLQVDVTTPRGSHLVARASCASVTATGELASAQVETGSGAVRLEAVTGSVAVKTGSGAVAVDTIGAEADLRAGSGDITVERVAGGARITTGSGTVRVGSATGAVALKSGSGDLAVGEADGDTSLSTASGDLSIGALRGGIARLQNVSGDITVGVPAGLPVWTDLLTTTGRVASTLQPVGAPADGQGHVEIRAKTLTGTIRLEQS
jgi:hypothetical protein